MTGTVNRLGARFVALSLLFTWGCQEEVNAEVPPAEWTTDAGAAAQPPGQDASGLPPAQDAGAQPPRPDTGGDDPPRQDAAPEIDGAIAPPSDCQAACEHLASCNAEGFDVPACVQGCEADDPARAECIITTQCDAMQACFEDEPPPEGCQAACEHIISCDFDGMTMEQCLSDCGAGDPTIIPCILSADCAGIPACMSEDPQTPCEEACARMASCQPGGMDQAACATACEADDPARIPCILAAACEALPACFEDEPPPPSDCARACERFIGCGFEIFEVEECVEVCRAEDASRATCMLEAECDVISGCLRDDPPPPDCGAVCGRIAGCQFPEYEEVACLEGCEGDTSERRACLMDAACEEMGACFPEDTSCQAVCDKMASCMQPGAPFDPAACLAQCEADDNLQTRECVARSDCPQVNGCF